MRRGLPVEICFFLLFSFQTFLKTKQLKIAVLVNFGKDSHLQSQRQLSQPNYTMRAPEKNETPEYPE